MDLFTTEIFTKGILPFLLVFVLIFAILQKSKLFGDGKSQIDALISLVIGLILIGFPAPRDLIVSMVPWLAVALVAMLIAFLIFGFAASDNKDGLKMPDWVKKSAIWIAIVFVIILVLVLTDGWNKIQQWYGDSQIVGNILIIVAIGVALWIALGGKKD
jgi:uncharacterized membrane protein YhdT